MFISNTLRGLCAFVSIFSLISPAYSKEQLKPLGLSLILEVSLVNHPKIKFKQLQLESKRAEARQANIRMNPEFELEFEDFGGDKNLSGTKSIESTATISQVVELGGKRKMRTSVKLDEVQILLNEIEIIKQEVIEETTNTFIEALASQENYRFNRELESIAKKALEVITKRVNSGKVALIDQERAEINLAKLKLKMEKAREEINTAYFKLGSLLKMRINPDVILEGDYHTLPDLKAFGDYEVKLSKSLTAHGLKLKEQHARTKLKFEMSNGLPNYEVGVGVRRFNETNENAFLMKFSIGLPLFNRNKNQIHASKKYVDATNQWTSFELLELSNLLNREWQIANTHKRKIELLRDKIIPKSKSIYESIKKGYTEGKFDYIDMLEGSKSYIESKQEYLTDILRYRLAVNKIQTITQTYSVKE